MPSELDPLTLRVSDRSGLSGETVANAIRETVTAFAARLPADLCGRVASTVPGPWRDALDSHPGESEAGPVDELYLEVANALDLPLGEALELAQVIVSELGSGLTDDQRRRVKSDLPDAWAELLEPPERATAVPPRDGPPAQPGAVGDRRGSGNRIATSAPAAETVADGRATSHNPVSE
jgi:hypothetical protein